MGKRRDSLTVTDNRTGKSYEFPILHGTYARTESAISAKALHEIKGSGQDGGLLCYDPALMHTAVCRGAVTFLDGHKGILRYRGYPVEELAEKSSFMETSYLLIHGELPASAQLREWTRSIMTKTLLHENVLKFIDGFHHNAHPMGILVSTAAALSTFYPDAREMSEAQQRRLHVCRLIAQMPTLAAFAYRHATGLPDVYPNTDLSYTGNLLSMMFSLSDPHFVPNPVLERALDTLFILHADHEQSASAMAVRELGSCRVDPYAVVAGGCAALYGQLLGSENVGVLRMLKRIGKKENVRDFLARVRAGEEIVMGFGHLVYDAPDPRGKIVKALAQAVFQATGANPLVEIAEEIERQAAGDTYFVSRKLFPNVHFYTGLVYQSMGFPVSMIPVLFAIARTAGWLAQWQEMLNDPEQKIARPRQIYSGPDVRHYPGRSATVDRPTSSPESGGAPAPRTPRSRRSRRPTRA